MHAHYELHDLVHAHCIPIHQCSVRIATGLSQIPQITKNTGLSPNINC